ncbi:phage/plasmid primase, P4 family [Anaerobium acetethylicum]|uniref:Phage/plasmid primase, P4 family, C-terminal domain-containing protein n=1 Tax=Anaerobium acetethylicum TaxID=1619234 RepID=A0A1D3TW06_9FIRM|nr:phage/plasmid primase, P4 family [Anaerobium acetethylicum]SCP98366.1 phage/plasmid primase, P4 family, C-terminal domain-containing protein [Anaerobium acetethylicum]
MASAMQELMDMKIWMLWRWAIDQNGKPTKKPFAAKGGATGTDDTWSNTWVTYNEAVKAKEHNSVAVGVGFKIPTGYYFIDIDHKVLTDQLVQTILARHDSYAEYSVSGTGIHQYGKCDFTQIPTYIDKKGKLKLDRQFYMKNPNNDLELYIGGITNRFAAYTGNIIEDKPLRECTAAVLTTLDKNMRRKEKTKYSAKRDGDRANFDIVCNLRKQKNGEKFKKLYDEGDISGYGSQSEADAALCALIAFRTGPDSAAIDDIFRSSALYREKWEREDYREATIATGIDACHGAFHKSKMEHPYFIKFNEQTGEPYVSVPLLAKYVREHLRYVLVRDNGKQGLIKYVYENGCYRLYADNMLMGIIKQYIADYDEELVKMGKVSETLQHITTDLNYVSQEELNADEDLINFSNGLLRITANNATLALHSPDILSTIQIPCSWTGKETPTPVFDRYMHTLTNGDKAIEQLLLEFIGVCISNIKGWRMKKALFLVGDGDTGKSQLKSLVERLLGKGNFIGIDLKEIEARFGTGAVYGTRLAGSSDMSFLSVDELKTFKKITGGDSLYAEFKGQQAFEFNYNGLLWFCMNRLPKFGGDDGKWVYDRIMVVRCPNVIPKNKQDKTLLDKMYAERDGIVYKAVNALQRVIANGYRFSEPDSVSLAREKYMSENNTVISFYEECMYEWPNGKINKHCTTGRIYKVYQGWCRENNNGFAKTAKEFRETLALHLGSDYSTITTRQNGNTYYKDYSLTLEAKEQFSREYGYDDTEFL